MAEYSAMTDSTQRRYLFLLVNYFAQGCIGIIYEPLNYLLKDRFHLTAGQTAGFLAWMSLPFLLKPLFGLIADLRPIAGRRRKPYLVASAIVATIGFGALAVQTQYFYLGILIPLVLANFGIAFSDATCGGLMVEDGKARHQTGAYQAIYIGAGYLSIVVSELGGGWISGHWSYKTIFMVTALLSVSMLGSTAMVHESSEYRPRQGALAGLLEFMKTQKFWALCFTLFLWNFYPFLGTVQFYYQSEVLKLSPTMIGVMGTVGAFAGVLGAATFWTLSRRPDSRSFVIYGPATMALINTGYLFYIGPGAVALVEALFGFSIVFFRLALFDLVAKSCPEEAEAASFALLLGLVDLAMFASNTIGGKLYDLLQTSFGQSMYKDQYIGAFLVLIGSLCTLACRWTLPAQGQD
jgi:MFS family permease